MLLPAVVFRKLNQQLPIRTLDGYGAHPRHPKDTTSLSNVGLDGPHPQQRFPRCYFALDTLLLQATLRGRGGGGGGARPPPPPPGPQ
jgi:hypothetical protein